MTRTCYTCEKRDRFNHCWGLGRFGSYVRDEDQACDCWQLGENVFEAAVRKSIQNSRDVFPEFVPIPDETYANYFNKLSIQSMYPGNSRLTVARLDNILVSKVYRFLSEVSRGDFDKAYEASADVVAILCRTLNGDGEKKQTNNE